MKQGVRQPPAVLETVVEGRRAEEQTGQFAECRITRRDEAQGVDRRCQPESADAKECDQAILKEQLQQVLGRGRFVAQVFDLAQPVEAFGLEPNPLMEAGWGRALSKPLRGLFDQVRCDVVMVVEDSPLAQERRQAWGMFEVLDDGLVFAVADVDEPVGNADQFLPLHRPLHQHDEVDVAMGRHGPSRAGPDEDDSDEVPAAFGADIAERDRQCIFVTGWVGSRGGPAVVQAGRGVRRAIPPRRVRPARAEAGWWSVLVPWSDRLVLYVSGLLYMSNLLFEGGEPIVERLFGVHDDLQLSVR